MGWLAGLVIGGVMSIAISLWLVSTTTNSRFELELERQFQAAKQARDWEEIYRLYTAAFDRPYAPGIWESPESLSLLWFPSQRSFQAAVETGNEEAILAEAERIIQIEKIIAERKEAEAGSAATAVYGTVPGVPICSELRRFDIDRLRYWVPAALHAGRFTEAIDWLRNFLTEFDACYRPVSEPAFRNTPEAKSVHTQIYIDHRTFRHQLAWALTCAQRDDEAIAEIDRLLDEDKSPWSEIEINAGVDPELLYLKAALTLRQGDRAAALSTYRMAQQRLSQNIPSVRHLNSFGRQLDTATTRTSINETWRAFRDISFGLPYEFSYEPGTTRRARRWSCRHIPEDPTEALVREFGPADRLPEP